MGTPLLTFPAIGLVAAAFAQAPEGYRTAENRARGLSLLVPSTFEEIPIAPGEAHLRMRFLERANDRSGPTRGEIWLVEGDPFREPSVATASPEAATPAESRPAGPPPVHSLPQYLERAFRGAKAALGSPLPTGGGVSLLRFEITGAGKLGTGVGFVYERGDRNFFYLGFAEPKRFEDLVKKFERSARSLTFKESSDALASDVEHLYRVRNFRNVEYRKEVRRNLAKGWKAEDTENFILVYDVSDKMLISKLKRDLEVVRTKFVELFPPAAPIEAVSTVRVCKDREEFLKFSGLEKNAQVAGFWNVNTKELVFYNAVKDPRFPNASHEDGVIVLYHEAFHQYIYYSAGEIAPHSWFNEGYGDYFSGAKIGGLSTRVERILVNPWRCGAIQRHIASKEIAPLEKLVRFEQKDYYAKAHVYYPQGWSFVYFLNESKAAKKHPQWSRILPVYFETLVNTYQGELAKAGAEPTPAQRAAAQDRARTAAVDAAFAGVDFAALQAAWEAFTLSLEDPRAKR